MSDNRSCGQSSAANPLCRDSVCIDCGRVLDSCKDKDCFADIPVHLTECGKEIIEKTSSIRVKSVSIVGANIDLEPVQFNRGFYQVYIRFYVRPVFEACLAPGRIQEFDGIAVCDKKVILYGSEGNVNIFKSDGICNEFCSSQPPCRPSSNLPTAIVEVIDPVCLSVKVSEKTINCSCCCCCAEEIPENICRCLDGNLCISVPGGKNLYISLGFFSIIRIERPGQYLINAAEYCIPEKECIVSDESDPCSVFEKMAFPVNEFSPPSFKQLGGCR